MKFPKLAYNTGRLGELLNNWNMLRWCTGAFLYGMLIYAVTIRIFTGPMDVNTTLESNGGYLYMEGVGFPNR